MYRPEVNLYSPLLVFLFPCSLYQSDLAANFLIKRKVINGGIGNSCWLGLFGVLQWWFIMFPTVGKRCTCIKVLKMLYSRSTASMYNDTKSGFLAISFESDGKENARLFSSACGNETAIVLRSRLGEVYCAWH